MGRLGLKESAETRVRNIFDIKNTLYGFYMNDNCRHLSFKLTNFKDTIIGIILN